MHTWGYKRKEKVCVLTAFEHGEKETRSLFAAKY